MIKKVPVLFFLLSMAMATIVVYSRPLATARADALNCKVAHYRTLGHRLWFHDQAMVDRDLDCDCEE